MWYFKISLILLFAFCFNAVANCQDSESAEASWYWKIIPDQFLIAEPGMGTSILYVEKSDEFYESKDACQAAFALYLIDNPMPHNQDIQCQSVIEYAKDDNGPWSFLIAPLNSGTWSDGKIQEWTLIANKNEQADKNACVQAAMNAYAELGDIRWNYVPKCFPQSSLFPRFTLPDGKEPADQEQYSGSWWLTPLPNPAPESTSQETSDRHWGFLISPIDLTAGSTDDQLVIWENRYIRDAKSYESRKVCEDQALIYAKDNPPGYNMAVKCVSPPPGTSLIAIDANQLNLAIEE